MPFGPWNLCAEMERRSMDISFSGDPSYLGDRLDGPHFVIRVHDAYEDGFIRQCFPDVFRIHNAVPVNREIGYADAVSFEILTGLEDGVVLDCGGDDMIAAIFAGAGDTLDGEIVCLCPAARKHDLRGIGADEVCHFAPRFFHGLPGLFAQGVSARGIAEGMPQERQHGFEDIRMQRRGRAMVKINGLHANSFRVFPSGADTAS